MDIDVNEPIQSSMLATDEASANDITMGDESKKDTIPAQVSFQSLTLSPHISPLLHEDPTLSAIQANVEDIVSSSCRTIPCC